MQKENVMTRKADEKLVADIEAKHMVLNAKNQVAATIIEQHARDQNAAIVSSPVFKEYEKGIAVAMREWENAKTKMFNETFTEEERRKILNWTLDYSTCEVTCFVKTERENK